jgi:hypothetical protein
MPIQPGDKFERWEVLHRVNSRPHGSGTITCWRCRCSCGTEKDVIAPALTTGISRSCGCLRKEVTRARCRIDLTNRMFDRLTVEGPGKRPRHWRCRCQCGVTKDVHATSLTSGNTRSCGCLRREVTAQVKTVHGQSGRGGRSPEWRAWWAMYSRCHYASNASYPRYGGRGIKVCRAYAESFEAFFSDHGPKPSPQHSVDRKDPNVHYSCGRCDECLANGWTANCQWATRQTQDRNRRSNRVIEHDGRSQCLAAWATETGIARAVIAWRLSNGWSVGAALTTPPHRYSGPKKTKTPVCQDSLSRVVASQSS